MEEVKGEADSEVPSQLPILPNKENQGKIFAA